MKKVYMSLIMAFVFISLYSVNLYAGSDKTNVLSYYAITNQLDGQPMIDMNNVLRFYPVFAFRDKTDEVHITVYKNGTRYHVPAIPNEDKSYWEIKLPPFELGEAIQRIETEVKLDSREIYLQSMNEYRVSLVKELKYKNCGFDTCSRRLCTEILDMLEVVDEAISADRETRKIQRFYGDKVSFDIVYHLMDTMTLGVRQIQDTPTVESIQSITKVEDSINQELSKIEDTLSEGSSNIHIDSIKVEKLRNKVDTLRKNIDSVSANISTLLNKKYAFESLKNLVHKSSDFRMSVKKRVVETLIDTSLIGSPIKNGDVRLSRLGDTASLLYRNYKRGLRNLTALDPAERLGIFRLRYIPFAIIGKELVKPVGDKPTGIFEVGMSFGDPIVTGDDFTVPPFAPERLGVAFAISNEFFSDSARVAALALTYDFNSYGSLAVGTNFNTKESKIQSYLSFGINKKAFEGLVKAIRKLFE